MDSQTNSFKTDLNDRERDRFAKAMRSIAEEATKCGDALEQRDDKEMVFHFLLLTLTMMGLKEMQEAIAGALKVAKSPDPPIEEFPSLIGG